MALGCWGRQEYFDKALGSFLLYPLERPQYAALLQAQAEGGESARSPAELYGAEHLCRLMLLLPEVRPPPPFAGRPAPRAERARPAAAADAGQRGQ
eukprot:SAG11_NODE_14963_length_593_cov_0.884615_1_plen_96_part_00